MGLPAPGVPVGLPIPGVSVRVGVLLESGSCNSDGTMLSTWGWECEIRERKKALTSSRGREECSSTIPSGPFLSSQ